MLRRLNKYFFQNRSVGQLSINLHLDSKFHQKFNLCRDSSILTWISSRLTTQNLIEMLLQKHDKAREFSMVYHYSIQATFYKSAPWLELVYRCLLQVQIKANNCKTTDLKAIETTWKWNWNSTKFKSVTCTIFELAWIGL